MKLTFCGAAQTVTGSKYLLEHFQQNFLVDCGLFQGAKKWRIRNWETFPFDPQSIQAVLLTHAHIDHSGALPLLVKAGMQGKIYCTHATYELAKILLLDAAHIQEEDADYANLHQFSKHNPALPLYTVKEAEAALSLFLPIDFNQEVELAPQDHLRFHFRSAGHILGAALVVLESDFTRVTFTGDLGRDDDRIMREPKKIEKTDFLVMESTYGDRQHGVDEVLPQLASIINETYAAGGTVVIPAFAVGRSQHVLYLLHLLGQQKKIPRLPVFRDSPMSMKATDIFCRFPELHRLSSKVCDEMLDFVTYVRSAEDSKKLLTLSGPKVIISASGMMTGGRILHHVKFFGPDPKNAIVMVGYQSEGTRGDTLLKGQRSIRIHGQEVEILAKLHFLNGLSSHADQKGLLRWASHIGNPPQTTFITHGELASSEVLAELLQKELGFKTEIPPYGAEYLLT